MLFSHTNLTTVQLFQHVINQTLTQARCSLVAMRLTLINKLCNDLLRRSYAYLIEKANCFSCRSIKIKFWRVGYGDDCYFLGRTRDVFITKLRKYLKRDSSVEILTLWGVGYRLVC